MVNKFILTLSCLLLTAEVSMQASRFAAVNIAAMRVQNDGSVILNGNSYLGYDELDYFAKRSYVNNTPTIAALSNLGYDELDYFAKRSYVNNTPTIAALSNTECMVFGIGAIIVAALVGCGLYCLSKPSNQKKQDQETQEAT